MYTYIKVTAEESAIGGTTISDQLMPLGNSNNIITLTFDPAQCFITPYLFFPVKCSERLEQEKKISCFPKPKETLFASQNALG